MPREDVKLNAYTGALNVRLFVKLLARDEADAFERLAHLDVDDAIDASVAYELIEDDARRMFFVELEPLAADGDEESAR